MTSHVNNSASMTPDNGVSPNKDSSSSSKSHMLQTPPMNSVAQSAEESLGYFKTSSEIPSEGKLHDTNVSLKEDIDSLENQQRKLSFVRTGCVPIVNLEQEFSLCPEATGNKTYEQNQEETVEENEDAFYDDQFYEGLDLDAVEAEATLLIKQKQMSTQKQDIPQQDQNYYPMSSPTFDLGI